MKNESRKANMKSHNIWDLANEARQEHKRYDFNNSNQARFNIETVARTLVMRRI